MIEAYLGEDVSGASPDVQMANGSFDYATPPSAWPGSDGTYGVGLDVYVDYSTGGGAPGAFPFARAFPRSILMH